MDHFRSPMGLFPGPSACHPLLVVAMGQHFPKPCGRHRGGVWHGVKRRAAVYSSSRLVVKSYCKALESLSITQNIFADAYFTDLLESPDIWSRAPWIAFLAHWTPGTTGVIAKVGFLTGGILNIFSRRSRLETSWFVTSWRDGTTRGAMLFHQWSVCTA